LLGDWSDDLFNLRFIDDAEPVMTIRAQIEERWNPGVGDCRQELVFIGIDMDAVAFFTTRCKPFC
tara:strand:+ start:113 stop:307 length:195 start_codon:yes stop_codon:yes gene_type:complete